MVSPLKNSLQLTPEKGQTTPRKRGTPEKDENTPPRGVQAIRSKFFGSPDSSASQSSNSPRTPVGDVFSSPTTGSAEKKLRTVSLASSPPAAAAQPLGQAAKKRLFEDSDDEEYAVGVRSSCLKLEQIRAIRFSQDSINFDTSDGQTLDELIESLGKHGWGRGYAPINIVEMPDGGLTTLDNRRLYAVMRVLETNPRFQLPVNIHLHSEEADKKTYLFPINRDAKSRHAVVGMEALKVLSKEQHVDAGSMGYCVYARMRVLTSKTPPADSFGYSALPVVRK